MKNLSIKLGQVIALTFAIGVVITVITMVITHPH